MRAVLRGLCAVSAVLIAGCSTSTPEPAQTFNSLAARIASHCTDVPKPELGPGTLCISNDFRIKRDDFSFSNWGRTQRADDNVTVQTLIDLFGYDNVCTPGPVTECVPRPTSLQFLELWNTALAGGRCEGLAALSVRLHLKQDSIGEFGNQYVQASQLTRRSAEVNQSIVYWWATQFVKEVKRSAADSRRKSPLALVDQLIWGLSHELGYTIGLYFESQGHSVTPFAVTNRDDNFVVHVYDNNFPNVRREILVNKVTNTWTYLGASTAVDGTQLDWTGTTGSFELTSMSSREGPFTCPFCTEEDKKAPSLVTLASRDANNPAFLRITSRNGDAEFSRSGFSTTIDGATVEIGKGGGNFVTINLPADVKEFDVSVNNQDSTTPSGDSVLSVIRPGFARLQVAGNMARNSASAEVQPIVQARKNNTAVTAPPDTSIDVSLTQGGSLVTRELVPLEEFKIARSGKSEVEVSVKGADVSQSLMVPIAENNVSQQAKITNSETTGVEIEVSVPTSVRARPQRTVNFTPRKVTPKKSTTTTTSQPSIEISEPD